MNRKKQLQKLASEIIAYYGQESRAKTPWGTADTAYQIERGVTWYNTPGHGGLGIANSIANKKLSPQARSFGEKWGVSFWYEEDVAYAIPFYEHPEWAKKFAELTHKAEDVIIAIPTKQSLEETIKRYYPDYFKQEFIDKQNERLKNINAIPILQPNDIINFEQLRIKTMTVLSALPNGRDYLGLGDDGRRYRIPKNHLIKYLTMVRRGKEVIWEKK